jgi:phosphonate transport system substrate-binding protein
MTMLLQPDRFLASILTLFAGVMIFVSSTGHAQVCERPARLHYSMVPEGDLQNDLSRFQPLLDDLEAVLGIPVDVITLSSYGAVVEGLLSGAVDVARLGPSSYLAAKDSNPSITAFATFSQARGAFQAEGPFYYSMLVVRAAGPIRTSKNLRGKTLALVDPDSTSGDKVPRQLFRQEINGPLENYFGRISYAGSHTNAASAVLEGRVDAAFVSSFQLSSMVIDGKAKVEDLRILWRSLRLPLDPFVYRGTLCPDVKAKIRLAFLGRSDKRLAPVLNHMNAVRFLPVQDSDYQVIKNLR